jgi:uncharacterized protein YyaL (SSP411 family)
MTETRRENRLAASTSPYLLQHAKNPVDWYPWGEAALRRATDEDKPILLSIGYAACHWCHVMERESFEDEAIAAAMNAAFVCIKVDREERPDLDEVYMAATIATTGSGGWPMTVFATPDGRPFLAGTYFPPRARQGRPGFAELIERIASLWKSDRTALVAQADELTRHLQTGASPARAAAVPAATGELFVKSLVGSFDARWGGFGGAPKFPAAQTLRLLLRVHARTGDDKALEMATVTLARMREGGMYDHLAGGFARYSTDEKWHVPHFEKMLYDNAQLVRAYLDAWQITAEPDHRRVVVETLGWMQGAMQLDHGGFASATDADSEGVEGKYFVFSHQEIDAAIDDDVAAEHFFAAYDVTPEGNWEGHNVLWTPRPLAEVAKERGLSLEDLEASLASSRAKLLAVRAARVAPLRDDKALAAWNGLAIGAFADAGRVLGEARFIESAQRAARFVAERLSRPDGGLFRTHRAGTSHLDAYLEDYAFVAEGLLDLYEATGSDTHLAEATRLATRMLLDFHDDDAGGFFQTAHGHEQLIVRTRDGSDGATPAANAVAARVLVRLADHLGDEAFRDHAARAIAAHGAGIRRAPRAFATSLLAVEDLLEPAVEVAIVGAPGDAGTLALERAVAETYLPHRAIARLVPAAPSSSRPLLAGKTLVDGKPAAYVCRNFACAAPVTDAPALVATLREATRVATTARGSAVRPSLLAGRATAEGTAAATAALPTSAKTRIGDLHVSRVMVAPRPASVDVETILERAFAAGCNVVFATPEIAPRIGAALGALRDRGALPPREGLVLIAVDSDESPTREAAIERAAEPLDVEVVDVLLGYEGDTLPLGLARLRASDAAAEPATDVARRVLVYGALEAEWRKREVRLDAAPAPEGPPFEDSRAALETLEEEYRSAIASSLSAPKGAGVDPKQLLSFAKAIAPLPAELGSLDDVDALMTSAIEPSLRAALGALDELPGTLGQRWARLRARYLPALQALLAALRARVASRAHGDAMVVLREIAPHLPGALRAAPPTARGLALALAAAPAQIIGADVATPEDADAIGIALRTEPFDTAAARRALA